MTVDNSYEDDWTPLSQKWKFEIEAVIIDGRFFINRRDWDHLAVTKQNYNYQNNLRRT